MTDQLDPSLPLANVKHESFCREYIVDRNKTLAAKRAGYAEKTCKEQGYRLFTNDHISRRVAYLQAESLARVDVSAERVLQQLARMAFSDPRHLFDEDGSMLKVTDLDDVTAMGVQSFEAIEKDGETVYKVKLADKKGALDTLAKHFGMLTEHIEHTGKDGEPLVPIDDMELARRVAFLLTKAALNKARVESKKESA